MPKTIGYFDTPIKEEVFGYKNEEVGINVYPDDIKDLLTMEWLNISIIQVWEMYLFDLCEEFGITFIGFMCPTQLSSDKKNYNITLAYVQASLKRLMGKKYILAPYIQSQHWILLIIDCANNKVFVFDSLATK